MTRSQKWLIVGGLALVLWGMCFGLVYAVFIEHQTLDRLGSSLATGFVRAAQRQLPESATAINTYADANSAYIRQVDAHSHWVGIGMLLIVLGAASTRIGFEERTRFVLAVSIVLGGAIFPLGVMWQTLERGLAPQLLAAAAAGVVILALGGVVVGLARGARARARLAVPHFLRR